MNHTVFSSALHSKLWGGVAAIIDTEGARNFDIDLEEHIDEYLQSKQEDGDDYFFAVTEHTNDVAMLLIDKKNKVHVNEKARAILKKYWRKSVYEHNIQILIPQMADELSKGFLFVSGVKIQESAD